MITKDEIVYVAFKLNDEVKEMLIDFLKITAAYCLGNFKNTYCDHMTWKYGDISDYDIECLGRTDFDYTLTKIIYDEHCITAVLENYLGYETGKHITLATDLDTNPVYSNKLFRKYCRNDSCVKVIDGLYFPLINNGTLMAYLKNGTWVDHL